MCFSVFSLFISLFWVAIFSYLVSGLRKKLPYLPKFSLQTLMLILYFCLLRVLLPFELPFTIILNSRVFLPTVQHFFQKILFQWKFLNITLTHLLIVIWISGVVILLMKQIVEYCYFSRLLTLLPASNDEHLYHLLGLTGIRSRLKNVKIIVHKGIITPVSAGCIKPVILIPPIEFDDDELMGILIHEAAHLQLKHILIKCIVKFVCIFFWWNPLLKKLFSEITHALEMYSDRAVCIRLNERQQERYLRAVTKIFTNDDHIDFSSDFTCGLLERRDKGELQQRFRMILEDHYRINSQINIGVIFLALGIFLLSYAVIPQPYSEPSFADYGDIDTTANTDFYYIESENGYDLYEYPNRFLAHHESIEDCMPWLQIYNSMEETEKR